MSPKSPPKLKVVFDTSVLFTGSASDLLNQDAITLIQENSNHNDLKITWHLPEIVILERKYQMQSKGFDYIPSIRRLENLLGHNLNITEEIITNRIDSVVEDQMNELKIELLEIDYSNIDWAKLVLSSAYRHPPFEAGKTEKGFRDAMIGESFLQLMNSSPKTPRICRLALVSNDKLLRESISSRIGDQKNIRLPDSLEDLEGLINTLVSETTERFVSTIEDRAREFFFVPDDESTFYYKQKVSNQIRKDFATYLEELPENATYRKNGTWFIAPPLFSRKKGQRVFWISRINVEAKAYTRYSSFQFDYPLANFDATMISPSESSGDFLLFDTSARDFKIEPTRSKPVQFPLNQEFLISGSYQPQLPLQSPSPRAYTETLIAGGKTRFEVHWSVLVSTKGNLSRGKIEKIEPSGTAWE